VDLAARHVFGRAASSSCCRPPGCWPTRPAAAAIPPTPSTWLSPRCPASYNRGRPHHLRGRHHAVRTRAPGPAISAGDRQADAGGGGPGGVCSTGACSRRDWQLTSSCSTRNGSPTRPPTTIRLSRRAAWTTYSSMAAGLYVTADSPEAAPASPSPHELGPGPWRSQSRRVAGGSVSSMSATSDHWQATVPNLLGTGNVARTVKLHCWRGSGVEVRTSIEPCRCRCGRYEQARDLGQGSTVQDRNDQSGVLVGRRMEWRTTDGPATPSPAP
jgi:hypothetical protein